MGLGLRVAAIIACAMVYGFEGASGVVRGRSGKCPYVQGLQNYISGCDDCVPFRKSLQNTTSGTKDMLNLNLQDLHHTQRVAQGWCLAAHVHTYRGIAKCCSP